MVWELTMGVGGVFLVEKGKKGKMRTTVIE